MRSLAAAYAVLALLAMPALLWAAEDPGTGTAPAPPAAEAAPQPTAPAQAAPEGAAPAAAPSPAPAAPASAPATTAPAPATTAAGPATTASPSAGPTRGKSVAADKETAVEDAPVARAAASGGVTIEDFAFAPRTITVDVGDTVTWTNRDTAGHTATADDGSFDTGVLGRGQSGSRTFDEAGTFAYHCEPHPSMTGTVVVRAAGDSAGAAGSGGGEDTTSTPGATSGATSSGSSLPATGLQVGLVALGGVLLLGAGAALRRRVED